ncbi:hypothetical protein TNCV_363221 [Trichonephila clavipes]|nr:hypothetical protein TNCV_363221 [Trichonephila clavipes]
MGHKPEKGNKCRDCDFVEAVVFPCLSDKIPHFDGAFEQRGLENIKIIHFKVYYQKTGTKANTKNFSGCSWVINLYPPTNLGRVDEEMASPGRNNSEIPGAFRHYSLKSVTFKSFPETTDGTFFCPTNSKMATQWNFDGTAVELQKVLCTTSHRHSSNIPPMAHKRSDAAAEASLQRRLASETMHFRSIKPYQPNSSFSSIANTTKTGALQSPQVGLN